MTLGGARNPAHPAKKPSQWARNYCDYFCARNSLVTGKFPAQRQVTGRFGVLFHLLLNKRMSKQWWGWWFKAPSCPVWCHCNVQWLLNGEGHLLCIRQTERLSTSLATATPPCWHQCKCQFIKAFIKVHSSYNALIWTQKSSIRLCVETLNGWQNQSKEFVLLLYWLTRYDFITAGTMW